MHLEQILICPIEVSAPEDKARHDKLVCLVERMLALHDPFRLSATFPKSQRAGLRRGRTPQEQEMVKREIESIDTRIDRLVYELYGLTEDEIKIVES